MDSEITNIVLPVGISFYTFQAISYLIDVYYGKVSIQKRLDHLAVYIVLFPQLIAGPIIRYHEIKDQIASRKDSLMNFSTGLTRFAYGLGKKVLIANVLGEYAQEAFSGPYQDLDIATAWIGTILYAFQIYFDFSGYSDMAIGLGKMFGFDFPENFNFPYAADSIKDFWRRWHITLSNWFRDYLYIPLGGNRKGSYRTLLNLLIVFIVTGFWHGAAWCFLIWGLIHGFFIVLERYWLGVRLEKIPRIFGILYTWLIVLIAWVFFREENLNDCLTQLSIMFGGGKGTEINVHFLNSLLYPKPLLILTLAFLFSTGILNWIFQQLERQVKKTDTLVLKYASNAMSIFAAFIPFIIMVLCTIELNLNSYNPFIYFRF